MSYIPLRIEQLRAGGDCGILSADRVVTGDVVLDDGTGDPVPIWRCTCCWTYSAIGDDIDHDLQGTVPYDAFRVWLRPVYLGHWHLAKTWDGGDIVGISNSGPKFPLGKRWVKERCLVPDWSLVDQVKKGILSREKFTAAYREQLDDNKRNVVRMLRQAQYNHSLLCCHEAPGAFCHRRVLAAWATEHGFRTILDPDRCGNPRRPLPIQEKLL